MNYKLEISYDGSRYAGWQRQNNARTIQGEIERAIEILLKEKINLIGSGRTDAGAHALRQVANFNIGNRIDNLNKFLYALNCMLPKDIAVNSIEEVAEDFHARYSAKKRIYYYLISKNKNPFFEKYSLQARDKLDIELLNAFASRFEGKKDFRTFSAKDCWTENRVCDVYSARWRETKELYLFRIESDRFLRGMIRAIVGAILHFSRIGKDISVIDLLFEEKNRELAPYSAPARGLFLAKVIY